MSDEIMFYGRKETLERYKKNPKSYAVPKSKYETIKEKELERYERKQLTAKAKREIEKENRPKLHKRISSHLGKGLDRFARKLF